MRHASLKGMAGCTMTTTYAKGQQQGQATSGGVNTSLWVLAFANAQPKEHSALCFSSDHSTQACEDYTEPSEQVKKQQKDEASVPICMKWNGQFCQSAYRPKVCVECHDDHKANNCPRLGSSRLPIQGKRGRRSQAVLFATSEMISQSQPQASLDDSLDSSINRVADYLIAKHYTTL